MQDSVQISKVAQVAASFRVVDENQNTVHDVVEANDALLEQLDIK